MGAVVSKVSGRSAFRPVFGLYPCGRFTTPVAVTEEVFLPLRSCNKACIPGSLTRGGHSGSPYPGWRVQCAAVSYLAGTPGRLARGGHSVCPCPRLAGAVGEGVLPRRHLGSSYPGWPVWVSLPRVGRCKGMRSSYLSSVCISGGWVRSRPTTQPRGWVRGRLTSHPSWPIGHAGLLPIGAWGPLTSVPAGLVC